MNQVVNLLSQVRIISQKLKEQREAKFERGEDFNIFKDLASYLMKSIYILCFWQTC